MMDEQDQLFMPSEAEMKWPVYFVPTVTVPELAPRGGSIIEIYPSIKQDMPVNDWDEQIKERIVELTVKAFARIHKIDIAVTRVTSPKDFQNRMHLYKGAAYGLSPMADPRAQFPHASPIRGLFQAGQTTFPGYGVSSAAMSGILTAEMLIRPENI
jgi:phytoene dehydrogenase-like protein